MTDPTDNVARLRVLLDEAEAARECLDDAARDRADAGRALADATKRVDEAFARHEAAKRAINALFAAPPALAPHAVAPPRERPQNSMMRPLSKTGEPAPAPEAAPEKKPRKPRKKKEEPEPAKKEEKPPEERGWYKPPAAAEGEGSLFGALEPPTPTAQDHKA